MNWDLIILGGGCAGLSLARELARAEAEGATVPRTLVIEPRAAYLDDRTWCFWTRSSARPDPLIAHRWSQWRFSSPSGIISRDAPGWSYCCIPGRRFYADALSAIDQAASIEVHQGSRFIAGRVEDTMSVVETTTGTFAGAHVVDTVPVTPRREDVLMMQSFAGIEVELSRRHGRDPVVGLMEHMAVDQGGFRFDYVLPLSPTRLLVEATRFSPQPVCASQLQTDLEDALDRNVRGTPFTRERAEQGAIPMGTARATEPRQPRWVFAGTRGGAVRPSSGYAYARIQNWARQCARSLLETKAPISHPPQPRAQRLMDRLFLSVLHDHPQRTPELFMDLAGRAPPKSFVRFMNDEASAADLLAMIRALPAPLFLGRLTQDLLSTGRRAA